MPRINIQGAGGYQRGGLAAPRGQGLLLQVQNAESSRQARQDYRPPMLLPLGENHLGRISDDQALCHPQVDRHLNSSRGLRRSDLQYAITQAVHQMHLSAFKAGVNWSSSLESKAFDRIQAAIISSPYTQHFRQSEINSMIRSELRYLKPRFEVFDTGSRFKSYKKEPGEKKRLDATIVRTTSGKCYELLNTLSLVQSVDASRKADMDIRPGKRQLGKGTYGKVRLARDMDTGEIVAVKKMKSFTSSKEELDQYRAAAGAHRVIQPLDVAHVYVKDKSSGKDRLKNYEFLPLFNKGDGYSRLKELNDKRVGDHQGYASLMKKTMFEYAEPVASMHKRDRAHRDIKLNNYLHSTKNGTVLTDLGLSIKSDGSKRGYGTPGYLPPEQHDSKRYTTKGQDAYALGRVFIELIHGTRDIEDFDDIRLFIRGNSVPISFDTTGNITGVDLGSRALRGLSFNTRDEAIAGLLARDPRDRLTVQEFLNTPFMKDYAAANGSEHVEGANIANDPRNYATEAELISRLSLNERENHDLTKDDIKTLINQADNENPFDDSDDEDEMLNIAIQESIQAQQRQRRGPPQPMRAAAPPPQPAGIAHDMGNYLPDDIDISQLL